MTHQSYLEQLESRLLLSGTDVTGVVDAVPDRYTGDLDEMVVANVLSNDSVDENTEAVLIRGPINMFFDMAPDGTFMFQLPTSWRGVVSWEYGLSVDGQIVDKTSVHIVIGGDYETGAVDMLYFFPMTGNTPPVAVDDIFSAGELDGNVLLNDFDDNHDTLLAILTDPPQHGFVELDFNGDFLYTPDVGFSGTDSFQYVTRDGTKFSDPATVEITTEDIQPAISTNLNLFVLMWYQWKENRNL